MTVIYLFKPSKLHAVVYLLCHVLLSLTSWIVACLSPLFMGFSRQEYWSWFNFLHQGIFLIQWLNSHLLPALAVRLFTAEPPGKPQNFHVSSVQSLGHLSVQLFVTQWTTARQASLSITNSWRLLKLMSIKPFHPLSSHSPLAFNLSLHQGLLKWISSLQKVAKVSEFQLHHQSFQWMFRTNFL